MLKLNNKKIMALALGASMLYTSGAEASGFHLREQSVGAQGEAMAGVGAGNSDISYMFFNPASLTYMEEKAQSQLDVSYLIGKTKAKAGRAASKREPS